MSYLYVFKTDEYIKLGITVDPKIRIKTHAVDLNQAITFQYLWKCDEDLYKDVEARAIDKLSTYPNVARERFKAPMSAVVGAILLSAEELGAELVTAHIPGSMKAVPAGNSIENTRIEVKLDTKLMNRLDKWRTAQRPILSKGKVVRMAMEAAIARSWFGDAQRDGEKK